MTRDSIYKLIILGFISVFLLMSVNSFAAPIIKRYMDVDSDDPDQKDPNFIKADTDTVGTPTKLRVTVCKDTAYTYKEGGQTSFPTSPKQHITIFVDVVDENGNIANQKAMEAAGGFFMFSLTFEQSGSDNNSFGSMPPASFGMLTAEGTQFICYDKEAESINITATTAVPGIAASDPATINFVKAASIGGEINIPANTAAQTLYIQLKKINDSDYLNMKFSQITTETKYTFSFDDLEAGNYQLQIMPTHNPKNEDLTKCILPICGQEPPYDDIAVADGEDKTLDPVNMELSTRGGVKGTISIAGRAAGDLSNTIAMVYVVAKNENFCISIYDVYKTITNSGGTNDGNKYFIPNLQAGDYMLISYVENKTTEMYEWMKSADITITNGAWLNVDLVVDPFFGMYANNFRMFETILYKKPANLELISVTNPDFTWVNDLAKDPDVPAGTSTNTALYDITVKDRCGNEVWEVIEVPHDPAAAEQTLNYGDTLKGVTKRKADELSNAQIYKWEVLGYDYSYNFPFSEGTNDWLFAGFNYGGGNPPVSGTDGGLRITCTDNRYNFGFWQSPQNAIVYYANNLYRARFMVAAPNNTSQAVVPQFRCRQNTGSFMQFDFLNIVSSGNGEAMPTDEALPYDLYFYPNGTDCSGFLAFDVLNIDPNDQSNGELLLKEVIIDRINLEGLKNKTSVASYDFESGNQGWVAAGSTTNSASGGALKMKCTNNTNTFGYWVNPAERVPYEAGKIYKGTFNVKSDAAKDAAPMVRFRYGALDQQVQMVQGITSVGPGAISPDAAGRDYFLYFYPPVYTPEPAGYYVSVDTLNIDSGDKADATVSVDSIEIETYDVPF